jgi:DNA-binding CsgD family transcriptional regulator
MLKDDLEFIRRRAAVRSDGIYGDNLGISCFDEAHVDPDPRDVVSRARTSGSAEPALTELLDLSGALLIAEAAWLCRISHDRSSTELLAYRGALSANEVAGVLESLAGPINLSHASAPFRWLSDGREYIVCTIGETPEGSALLVLRANRLQAGDWPQAQEAAARAQRLMAIFLSTGEAAPARPAPSQQSDALSRGAINILPFGVVVVDINQTILLANDAMQGFFAETDLVANLGGKLAVLNSDDAVRFHVALGAVIAPRTRDDQSRTIALASESGNPILLSISRLADDGQPPRACIVVTASATDYRAHVQPLAKAFALTPVETRVVAQLTEGYTVQEAAAHLKLKVETVRTYLKQVFQKTGTHRQVDLIQLMKCGALPMLA